jgi:hypothetical protein
MTAGYTIGLGAELSSAGDGLDPSEGFLDPLADR